MTATINNLEKLIEKQGELQNKLIDVQSDLVRINDQLGRAKSKAASTGDYSDTKWFRSASAALNHRKVEHQNILMQLSSIKTQIQQEQKAQNMERANTFERLFMKVAKRNLSEKKFQALIDATHIEKSLLS